MIIALTVTTVLTFHIPRKAEADPLVAAGVSIFGKKLFEAIIGGDNDVPEHTHLPNEDYVVVSREAWEQIIRQGHAQTQTTGNHNMTASIIEQIPDEPTTAIEQIQTEPATVIEQQTEPSTVTQRPCELNNMIIPKSRPVRNGNFLSMMSNTVIPTHAGPDWPKSYYTEVGTVGISAD